MPCSFLGPWESPRNKHPALNEPGVMIMNNPEEAWSREAWDFSIILDGLDGFYRDNNWISIKNLPSGSIIGDATCMMSTSG